MTPKQEKQLAVLNETIAFYNSANRSINNTGHGACMYINNKGNKCAIGRLVTDELARTLEANMLKSASDIFHLLPKEVQDLGLNFLEHLQVLHDNSHVWNTTGLTRDGEAEVRNIKMVFNLA